MVVWNAMNNGGAAITAAVRTPFTRIGTNLAKTPIAELARTVFQESVYRGGLPGERIDEVILGNVVMPADATNPARVAAIQAGLPHSVPALTVQRNCASGMEAISEAATRIQRHEAHAVLAGGAESMSTIPLLFPEETLEPVGHLMKAKSLRRRLAAVSSFRPRHFKPRAALELGLTDPTCGMIMGKTAEVLAHEFAISRAEQDAFALQSHHRTTEAAEAHRFDEQITPVYTGPRFEPTGQDVGPRSNQTLDALARLKPIFDRRDGTVTVGNSCQVTDGAASMLVMDPEIARAEGIEVLGTVRGYATAGLDPARMGLGPVFAINQLLNTTGVSLNDVGLFEINEAFAAQVLACLKAMSSDRFAREQLQRDHALGEIDPGLLNVNGGAIALGHPVGASGARLVLNLLYEMRRRDVELGIAALCVGGGQGAAILLQRS